MEKLSLILNPSNKHLEHIKEWLFEEYKKYDEGFYHKWDYFLKSFTQKRMAVISENNIAVGFIVYLVDNPIAKLEFVEIKPSERKKGLGKRMINAILAHFKSIGILVVHLKSSPESSEGFWKHIGFLNFPQFPYKQGIRLFKPLIQTGVSQDIIENSDNIFFVELWDREEIGMNEIEPKWKWKLMFQESERTLEKPIIFPVHYDWTICLKKGNQIIEKSRVKNFMLGKYLEGDFIIIQELPVTETSN